MKIEITKDWLDRQPDKDQTVEIAAGPLSFNSLKADAAAHRAGSVKAASLPLAFGRLIQFARLERGWTVEMLARETETDLAELRLIETFAATPPSPRTVFQLKRALRLTIPEAKLLILAGHAHPNNQEIVSQAERFAARSLSLDRLTPELQAVLKEFINALAER